MTVDADFNRRQVLYWRLIARLFSREDQAALESASLAVIEDLGLPAALLDPSVSQLGWLLRLHSIAWFPSKLSQPLNASATL